MLPALQLNRKDDALINDKIFPECAGAPRTLHVVAARSCFSETPSAMIVNC